MKRADVYKLIDGERDYQEALWPVNPLTEGEFISLLQDYVNQARTVWAREPKPCQATMGIIRKIASIAVNAMEQHGAPAREAA